MGRHASIAEIVSAPAHDTLRRVVMWFRILAMTWMAGLSIATLVEDPGADDAWVVVALAAAAASTAATVWLALRGGLSATWWIVADGAVSVFAILAPSLAGAENLFYGGMPLSWLLLVVWARPTLLAGAAAVAVLVAAQLVAGATGIRTLVATDYVGDIAVWIVSGIVYGWGLYAIRETDVERLRSEGRLLRANLAADLNRKLHDSVLQELAAITMQPERHEVADVARRLDRMIRRELNRTGADHPDGLRVRLYEAVEEVCERFGVWIHPAVVTGDCPGSPATEAVVDAAREALVNAIRHSGTDRITVSGMVEDGEMIAEVRDFGQGFDTAIVKPTIADRVERLGGAATVESGPGGTVWVIRAPCASS